jgi:hypothetical protein
MASIAPKERSGNFQKDLWQQPAGHQSCTYCYIS